MGREGFKRNKVKVDLCSYPPYLFLAPRKFGKTTFWYDLVREAWEDDSKGLLISFGREEGYHSLDGIQVEVAKEWNAEYDEDTDLRGFVQIVDDLIDNNEKYGIKGVCFDTLDTMVDVATAEVLRQHRIEKKTACKSLNDAFGGYRRGVDRLLDMINCQIERLRSAGLAVFILCHVKLKEKTDLKSGEKFEQITNNLQDAIYTSIADNGQIVMVGVMEREINNGKILSENRVIYMRGSSEIDAGGRFGEGLPEKISLDPKEFLKAFENAVKCSMKDTSDTGYAKLKAAEEKSLKQSAKIAVEKDKEKRKNNEEENIGYLDIIKENYMDLDQESKDKIKEIMSEYNIHNFKSADVSTEGLKKIVAIIQ